jgi:hypothetical protein
VAALIGSADAIVSHLDMELVEVDSRADCRGSGVRVLDDVRERFGDDKVRARLDLGYEPLRREIHRDREVETLDESIDASAEPSAGEVCRKDPM